MKCVIFTTKLTRDFYFLKMDNQWTNGMYYLIEPKTIRNNK